MQDSAPDQALTCNCRGQKWRNSSDAEALTGRGTPKWRKSSSAQSAEALQRSCDVPRSWIAAVCGAQELLDSPRSRRFRRPQELGSHPCPPMLTDLEERRRAGRGNSSTPARRSATLKGYGVRGACGVQELFYARSTLRDLEGIRRAGCRNSATSPGCRTSAVSIAAHSGVGRSRARWGR
jgi:hypothetical protein